MLINGWSGSGGDAFPFYFREAGLGPLIGTRTWGGLIGISGAPALVDGGGVTVPTFRMFDPKGQWFAEGHGVEPDIAVDDDPAQLAKGIDPQLAARDQGSDGCGGKGGKEARADPVRETRAVYHPCRTAHQSAPVSASPTASSAVRPGVK